MKRLTTMYIGDLCNADKGELDKIDLTKIEVKHAELYCTVCSSLVNITRENLKTLPVGIVNTDTPLLVFKHSPVYSGRCLMPGCAPSFGTYGFPLKPPFD